MDSRAKLANDLNSMAKSIEKTIAKALIDTKKNMNFDAKDAKMVQDALKQVNFNETKREFSSVQKDVDSFLKKYNGGNGK